MRIIRLHHAQITVPRGAEAEARTFYCELLGLVEIPKPESLIGRGGFWLQLADQQVHVGVEDRREGMESKAHLAYEVDDLPEWRMQIERNGLQAMEGESIPGFIRFETRDPFGNRLEFIQAI